MTTDRVINFNSVGIYNPATWIEEGDGLLASARSTRATWLRKCRAFDPTSFQGVTGRKRLNEIKGHPRASMLLLAYAAEMYLKAGVVKVFSNCREEPVGKWLSNKIRHDYLFAAKFVEFELSSEDRHHLEFLTELVSKMRYPVVPNITPGKRAFPFDTDHTSQTNNRTSRLWSQTGFRNLCSLVKRISAHARCIDQDESNPAIFRMGLIGDNGSWVFRLGGNLSPRVTYRLCPEHSSIDGATVRKYIEGDSLFARLAAWETCNVLVDNDFPNGKGFSAEPSPKALTRKDATT